MKEGFIRFMREAERSAQQVFTGSPFPSPGACLPEAGLPPGRRERGQGVRWIKTGRPCIPLRPPHPLRFYPILAVFY